MKWWDRMPRSSFSECWVLSQLFHYPLSLSSRISLVPFHFLHKGGAFYISEVIDISPSTIPSCALPSTVFLMMYSAYRLNKQGDYIQPWCTPFPIWNQSVIACPVLTVLLDLHTDFSGSRSGCLVFPSLSEFSIVCCDPHSQRLWHSQ